MTAFLAFRALMESDIYTERLSPLFAPFDFTFILLVEIPLTTSAEMNSTFVFHAIRQNLDKM